MFRRSFAGFALAVAATVAAFAGSPSTANAQTPIEDFRNLSYEGVVQAYYGYLYCYYGRQTALLNGFSDEDTGYVLLYGELYAQYAYEYGYYALILEYSEYALAAADMANAAWNYEYGIYSYVYTSIYPTYPQTYVILEPTLYGYTHMLYAEIYFRYAYAAVN